MSINFNPMLPVVGESIFSPVSEPTYDGGALVGGGPAVTDFTSSWKTDNVGTSNNDQITIPTVSAGTYNCTIFWGDGNSDAITTWNDAAWTHTYSSTGTYTVQLTGTFTGFRFNNGGDKLKLLNISVWGDFNLGNAGDYFYGCSNLTITSTDVLDLTGTTDLSFAFRNCTSLVTVSNINSWDTSSVTNGNSIFRGCTSFNQALTFNTSSMTNMSNMFFGCISFNSSLTNFLTSTTNIAVSMFEDCCIFNQDISSFVTSSVTDMSFMFSGATVFNQDISGWNTALVTEMGGMFAAAVAFNQDIDSWTVTAVTSMQSMFQGATAFNQDLSSWNVVAVTTMADMFNASALNTTNYDLLLIGWSALSLQSSVPFHAGTAQYSVGAATTARGVLTVTFTWSITDGGQV